MLAANGTWLSLCKARLDYVKNVGGDLLGVSFFGFRIGCCVKFGRQMWFIVCVFCTVKSEE